MRSKFLILSLVIFLGCGSKSVQTETAVIKIPTSICGECARTIKNAVMKVNGVTTADINTETKLAVIEFISTSAKVAEIEHAIVMAGYGANGKQRDAEAFEKLPDCCKK